MKSTGYFYFDRQQAKRAQQLNSRLLENVIVEDSRLSEVSVPTSVRGLSKSHQIARVADNRANVEASMFRAAHLARVGNRAQEQRDKYKAAREAKRAASNPLLKF